MQYKKLLQKAGIGPRRTKALGSGAYFKARLILPQKNDARKRATLAGKVIKQLKHFVTAKEAKHIRTIMKEYASELKKAGIRAIDFKMVSTITKKPGLLRITFIQQYVPAENMLHNYLKVCPAKEAVKIFSEMVMTADLMDCWSRNHPGHIGLDMRTTNYAIVDGKLTLMDLYPPIVMQKKDSIKPVDLIKMRRDPKKRLHAFFAPKRVRELTRQGIRDRMDPKHQQRHILEDFTYARPELKELFTEELERKRANRLIQLQFSFR